MNAGPGRAGARYPVTRYVEQILALLVNIELNKFDHRRTALGTPIVYACDADVAGFYLRPKGHQARYANMGFIESESAQETDQAILTGEFIFDGNLPGREAGAKMLVFPSHALEISEMREAIRRSLRLGEEGDPEHLGRVQDYRESLALLAQLLSTRVTAFELYQITTEDVPHPDPKRTGEWLRALDRVYPPLPPDPEPFDVKRRERVLRRDAESLSRAETLRDHLKGRDLSSEFLFISGSRHIHAAFGQVQPPASDGQIAGHWLRHPLQYTPYLNLISQGVEARRTASPAILERLEAICREALQGWGQPLDTFEELMAARAAAYPSDEAASFGRRCEEWRASLPRAFFEEKYEEIAQHWTDVAAASAAAVGETREARRRDLERALHATAADGHTPETAVEELRHASLSLDASRDIARSIAIYAGQVRAAGAIRRVHAPIRQSDGGAIGRAVDTVLIRHSAGNREAVRMLFELIEGSGSASIRIETAALVAVRAHQWQAARRWAHELVERGRGSGPILTWATPGTTEAPSVHAWNAWLIRCIAGRYGGFAEDSFVELDAVAAADLVGGAERAGEPDWIVIAAAERLALGLFAAVQLQFGSDTEKAALRGAPNFTHGAIRAMLGAARTALDRIADYLTGGRIDAETAQVITLQLAANIGIAYGLFAILNVDSDDHLEDQEPLIARATSIIRQAVAATAERASPPTIHQLSLALLDAVRADDPILARTTIKLWAGSVPPRGEPEAVKFDKLLKRGLTAYGFA